jgi:hypothetical protein
MGRCMVSCENAGSAELPGGAGLDGVPYLNTNMPVYS